MKRQGQLLNPELKGTIVWQLIQDDDHEMRFMELWEKCKKNLASKSTFKIYLDSLVKSGDVERKELSHKNVRYSLKLFRSELEGFQEEIREYFELLRRQPNFRELEANLRSSEFQLMREEKRKEIFQQFIKQVFSYYSGYLTELTIGYMKYKRRRIFEQGYLKGFQNLTSEWLKWVGFLFDRDVNLAAITLVHTVKDRQ